MSKLETPRLSVTRIEPLVTVKAPTQTLATPKKKPGPLLPARTTEVKRSAYSADSLASIGTARDLMALKRSARDKTFVPTEMDRALQNWVRASPKNTSAWDRPSLWTKRDSWENPSSWKGATLDQTQTSLTALRGRTKSWAERHPLQATYGTRPAGKR